MINDTIEKTVSFVKEQLKNAEGGHDWFHIERVYKMAIFLAEKEGGDKEIIALAALLHDIADYKFYNGDEKIGTQIAKDWMEKNQVNQEILQHVLNIIENISFKGGNQKTSLESIEFKIVQDADRLDALGAIGIARTFNYGGYKNRKIVDPEQPPQLNMNKEAYKNNTGPTINHFYEKLLLLKDKMNTQTAKKIAKERHEFLELFLEQFYREVGI